MLISTSVSLYQSYCPAGLHIIYAHPQSCSETKKAEETDRERDIWKERYRGGGRKRGTRRDRRVRVQSSYSYSEVILCESTILPHYLFCLSHLPTPLTHTRKTPLINIKVQCQLPWEYTSGISLTLYRGTQD